MVGVGALSMGAARLCVSAAGVTAGGGPQRGGQSGRVSQAQLGGFATGFRVRTLLVGSAIYWRSRPLPRRLARTEAHLLSAKPVRATRAG